MDLTSETGKYFLENNIEKTGDRWLLRFCFVFFPNAFTNFLNQRFALCICHFINMDFSQQFLNILNIVYRF